MVDTAMSGKYVERSWNIQNAYRYINVEIGTEAAQFPEKDYINWLFLAV
jgi:hypothetical protein